MGSLFDEARNALPVGEMVGGRHRKPGPKPADDGLEDALAGLYPAGRRCADRDELGCITILSVYNPGPWCFAHRYRHVEELAEAEEDIEEFNEALARMVA